MQRPTIPTCWLTARDHWFERYHALLTPYLTAPRVAQVITFAPGKLADPFSTFKTKRGGPCPLPQGAAWPRCDYCRTEMVLVGVLDFRQFTGVKLPGDTLVLHGCPECGFCADPETWAVHWLKAGEPIELHGDLNAEVELGTRWWATEYPTPDFATLDRLLPSEWPKRNETATYTNFSCAAEKVGGHALWIQGEEDFTKEYHDTEYVYIGQMMGDDESLHHWDSPVIYLMYAPATGATVASLQSF